MFGKCQEAVSVIGVHPMKTNHCHFCWSRGGGRGGGFWNSVLWPKLGELKEISVTKPRQLSLGLWMHFMHCSDCSIASQRNQWPNCFSSGLVEGLTTFKVHAWLEMWTASPGTVFWVAMTCRTPLKHTLGQRSYQRSLQVVWTRVKVGSSSSRSSKKHDAAGMKLGTRDSVESAPILRTTRTTHLNR